MDLFSAKKLFAGQAEKVMYSLIRKSRLLMLPIDLQIELFKKMVQPILLYGVRYGVLETSTC